MKSILLSLPLFISFLVQTMDEIVVRKEVCGLVSEMWKETGTYVISTVVTKHKDGRYTESAVRAYSSFPAAEAIAPDEDLVARMKAAIEKFESDQEKK